MVLRQLSTWLQFGCAYFAFYNCSLWWNNDNNTHKACVGWLRDILVVIYTCDIQLGCNKMYQLLGEL